MKKIIGIIVFVCSLMTVQAATVKTNLVEEDLPKLTKVVSQIAKEALKDVVVDKETTAFVTFTVNADNELVILGVRTLDKDLKQTIKMALNNKSIEDAGLIVGKPYTINIRLKQ